MANPTPYDLFGEDGISVLKKKGYSANHIRAMAQTLFTQKKAELQKAEVENRKAIEVAKKFNSKLGSLGEGLKDGATAEMRKWTKLYDDVTTRELTPLGEKILEHPEVYGGLDNTSTTPSATSLNVAKDGNIEVKSGFKISTDPKYSRLTKILGVMLKDREKAYNLWQEQNDGEINFMYEAGRLGSGILSDPTTYIPVPMSKMGQRFVFNMAFGVMGGAGDVYARDGSGEDIVSGALIGAVATPAFGEALHQSILGVSKLWNKYSKIKLNKTKNKIESDELLQDDIYELDIMQEVGEDGLSRTETPIIKSEKQTSFENFFNEVMSGESLEVREKVYKDILEGKNKSIIDKEIYGDLLEFKRYEKALIDMEHRQKGYDAGIKAMDEFNIKIATAHDNSVIRYNEIQKDIKSEVASNPKILPAELKTLINVKYKPTNEEIKITEYINDGIQVENRLSGYNVLYALQKDIQNPIRSKEEYKAALEKAGFSDESSTVFSEAYEVKDIDVAKKFISKKVEEEGVQDVEQKTNEAIKKSRTKEPSGDGGFDREATPIPDEDGYNGYDPQRGNRVEITDTTPAKSSEIDVKPDSIRRSKQDPPSDGEVRGVPEEHGKLERQQSTRGDVRDVPRAEFDGVVRTEVADDITSKSTSKKIDENFDLNDKEAVVLSKAERKATNTKVDEILDKPKEAITPEDREILYKYTGKGGLEKGTFGSLSEHYTPYETVRGIYKALDDAGIKIKKALEPSAGAGNFVGHKPRYDWTTIDIDSKAHAINERLYPKGRHYNMSFEKFKGDGYDLVISNVPFIETRGAAALDIRSDVKTLHDFFFVHGIDRVKDDGVVAFVAPRGVMDKANNRIRKELMGKADVIGAYRLPDGTFSKNAHTDVGADVIFLQKRAANFEPTSEQLEDNKAFIKSTKTEDGLYLNEYYTKNPDNILGDLEVGINKQYGTESYVVKGNADYGKIKLKPHDNLKKEKIIKTDEITEIPTDSKDFYDFAKDNGLEVGSINEPRLKISGDGVRIKDKDIFFRDIEDGAITYKDISSTINGKKIAMLETISKLAEKNNPEGIELIREYQKIFKTHPFKDRSLKALFNEINDKDSLYRLGSYFNKNFEPSAIFSETTKYVNSGLTEADKNSPLHVRLKSGENNKGIIHLADENPLYSEKDIHEVLDNGYSLIGKNQVQNDILYYSGNLYDKIKDVRVLADSMSGDKKILEKLDVQEKILQDTLPEKKGLDDIEIVGTESWLLENGLEIYPISWKERTIRGGEQKIKEMVSGHGKIFDNYINSKALIAVKKEESVTSYRRRLREAKDEVQQVLNKIKESIFANPKLAGKLEDIYNRKFNGYVSPDYKKASYIINDVLEELPANFKLRENQKNWIIKALYEGKSINAHDVGGGKTFSGIVLARVLKKRGIAKKPLFVVPAKVLKNWEKEIKTIYPEAKVVNLFNLAKSTRSKKLFELGNNNADFILISHEGFKELKLPQETEMRYTDELMNENLKIDDLSGRAKAIRAEAIKKYKEMLKRSNNDKRITIDSLGIDAIFADEARAFKNVGVNSKLARFKLGKPFGISVRKDGSVTLDSAKAYDFRLKTRYISERNNGNNIFMLDATPTPNKPMEIFTMLKHLDNNIFAQYGIKTDMDFATRFFEFGAVIDKKGNLTYALSALKNAYELNDIMGRYIDRISMHDFKEKGIIDLPDEKSKIHYLDSSDESEAVFEDIQSRIAEIKKDASLRHKMMGVFSEGISASSDPRSYQRGQVREFINPTSDNNKVEAIVEAVSKKRKEDEKAGQVVFLDKAGHEQTSDRVIDEEFFGATLEKNIHQEIKEKLINSGYKPTEIAIISGKEITNASTGKEIRGASGQRGIDAKQAIVEAYNKGNIKVIIGTTESAGEGMNIQKYTTDIYHMDLPWTHAQIQQRNGRGVRYGNQYDMVNIHYYFQAGTFDELMYKTVTNKRGWNEALWDAEVKNRIEISDESSSMPSEEEFMLQMEKDPVKRRELELQIEYSRMEDELINITEERNHLKFKKETLKRQIKTIEVEIIEKQELLRSDAPNKYLREIQEKMLKTKDKIKRAKYKKDYDYKLGNARKRIKDMIVSKKKRIENSELLLKKNEKDIEIIEKDVINQTKALDEFEAKHVGADEKIKSELEEVC